MKSWSKKWSYFYFWSLVKKFDNMAFLAIFWPPYGLILASESLTDPAMMISAKSWY